MDTHELAKSAVTVERAVTVEQEGEYLQLVKVQDNPFCICSPGAIHGYIIEEIEFALDDQIEADQEPNLDEAVKTSLANLREKDMDWWKAHSVWEVL